MSYFLAKNNQKSKNYAYFAHFLSKKFKKSAIFVQATFQNELAICPIFVAENELKVLVA